MKTHYRKVFKSDHLGCADLEDLIEQGKRLVFTVKHVKQEKEVVVAGKKGDYNIAYFVEAIKPLVLNATNSDKMRSFSNSPFVEDWNNIPIELYINSNVRFGRDIVSGVRISPVQPKKQSKPLFTEENFEKAKNANATIESISSHYTVTEEIKIKYNKYVIS